MQPTPVANAGDENELRYYEAPFFSPPPYAGGGDTMMMNTCDACNGWDCFMPVHGGASSPPCQPIVQRPMGGEVCWYYMHGEYGCLRQDCPFFHPIVTFSPPPPPPTPLPFSNGRPIVSKPLTDVRVYVGNIPADFAEAYYFRGLLEAECGRVLLIDFISILYNRRCSAFIHMMRDKDAEAVVAKLDGMTLDGVELYARINMSLQLMPGDRGYSRLASMIGDEAEEDEGGEEEESDGDEEDCGDASPPAILCLPPQSPLPPLIELSEEESPTSVILCAAMKVMTPFGLEKSPDELFVEDSSEC